MENINQLIGNQVIIGDCDFYAAIIGEKPSAGARSPLLWNAAFKAFDMQAEMVAFDVDPPHLSELINELEKDHRFIGGAVAFPYKSSIANLLSSKLTPAARTIGAINCIFRDEKGFLSATNTDGEACIQSLKNHLPALDGLSALVLGSGGASKAVCAYLAPELGKNGRLHVAYRNTVFSSEYLDNLGICNMIDYSDIRPLISSIDLIINCTLLGGQKYPSESPLRNDFYDLIKEQCYIYDINYDPIQSPMLKDLSHRGHICLNGIEMNLLQAVLAFNYACGNRLVNTSYNDVYKAMSCASNSL